MFDSRGAVPRLPRLRAGPRALRARRGLRRLLGLRRRGARLFADALRALRARRGRAPRRRRRVGGITLRLFTPAAPLCVGGAPAALEPLAAAYDGLARDAAAAGLLPPRAPNRWDAPLALAPGRRGAGRSRRPRPAPRPRRHAAALLRPPGRGGAEPPPLPAARGPRRGQ